MKWLKIKFNPFFLWRLSIFIFLFLLGVLVVFNVFYFLREKNRLTIGSEEDNFIPERVDKQLMLKLLSDIESREQAFQKILLKKPDIKNPSSF